MAGPAMSTGGREMNETGQSHQCIPSDEGDRVKPLKEFCVLCCGARDQSRCERAFRLTLLSACSFFPTLKKNTRD